MRSERAVLQDIGRNVRALREAHGLDQVVLAERVGAGVHTIRRIERATGNPNIKTVIAIASYFRVEFVDLCAAANSRTAARHLEPRLNRDEIEMLIRLGKAGQRLKARHA